jgi:hypothetical protein
VNSFITTTPYNYYLSASVNYIIDRTYLYSKYTLYTRAGRLYKRDFYIGREWNLLRRAKDKLSLDIKKNESELNLLEPELSEL